MPSNCSGYPQDARDRMATSSFKNFDLSHQLAKLRYGRNLSKAEVEAIFKTLAKSVRSDEQIIEVRFFLFGLPACDFDV